MRDLRQTPQYAKYIESIDWTAEKIEGTYAYIKRFPIIGNFIKIQRPHVVNSNSVNQLIHKYKPFQFVIEPQNEDQASSIKHLGFKQSKSYFVPSKTIQIDLTKSENQLLKEMHHKTRYNIKKVISDKLEVISSKDIESFANFWQKCALDQRGMFLSQKEEIIKLYKAFGENAKIISVVKGEERMSSILIINSKDITYYMYAASTDEGKRLFAPTLNVWESIKFAKKINCKLFDFEGIFDTRFPIKTWQGFTRFKKSFGGKEVEYPGAFTKHRFSFLNFLGI